jgi:hypothetical protein
MAESTILDQLRLQEGHLFQNERILAMYLDVKAVLSELLVSKLRANEAFVEASDAILENLEKSLESLSPSGTKEYHAASLYETVRVVSKLLWPTEILLVARPKISGLLKGMCLRLSALDTVRTRAYLELDPIKQDFVVREAFRRTVVNDCLVVFEDTPPEVVLPPLERPKGAHSTIGPINDDVLDDASSSVSKGFDSASVREEQQVKAEPSDERSVAGHSVAGRSVVARSVAGRSVAQSVAPKVFTAASDGSVASKRSAASATSSVLRKPFNVRRIRVEETIPE